MMGGYPRRCAECGGDWNDLHVDANGRWTCVDHRVPALPREMPTEMEDHPPSPPLHLSGESPHLSGGSDISVGQTKYAARTSVLGLPARLGSTGTCCLPGHDDHDGRLVPKEKGLWMYSCPALERSFSLGSVRAIFAYADVPYYEREAETGIAPEWRRIRPPKGVEESRWAELLDYEAGLLVPRKVPLLLPSDLSPAAMCAGEQIRLLLGLRSQDRWIENIDEFTFARRMCRARCGFSDDVARRAMEELRARRLIVECGMSGRCLVYRVGDLRDIAGSEDAMVEMFAEAFNATEEATMAGRGK